MAHQTNKTAPTPRQPVGVEPPASGERLEHARRVLRAESEAIRIVLEALDERFNEAVDLLVETARKNAGVVVTGMGKSGLIGQKISATLSSLGVPSHFLHPAEATHGDLGRIRRDDCVLALSYSGRTHEVVTLATLLRQDEIPIISITRGRGDSALERLSTIALPLGEIEEACPLALAPTSSSTATLALGDALALEASRLLSFTPDDFAKRHPSGLLGDLLRPVTDVLRFRVEENLAVCDTSMSVGEALRESSRFGRRPGAMVIVGENGALAGLFTDGDLRRLVVRDPNELNRPIEQVMTASPRTLPADALVRDAVQMVREHRQDEIPIVGADGAPVGVLDVQDLIALKVVRE